MSTIEGRNGLSRENYFQTREFEKYERDHASPLVKVTTIDQFVSENQIRKVDFIKADIEGTERYMLRVRPRHFADSLRNWPFAHIT